jgi:cyanamide hydratase family protein with HD domain
MSVTPLPSSIAGLPVPQDGISAETWRWARSTLPRYLFNHSVRSYCWGAEIAAWEGRTFDAQVLWTAALFHDVGLTRIPRNTLCFEVEGAAIARRFLEEHGMSAATAERAANAIVLHMRPGVTSADGVEALLLDRATAVDVRGVEYDVVERVRASVVRKYPRGHFDRHFLRAIRREVAVRPTCQSARLLNEDDLEGSMARSQWATPR